MGIVTGTGDGGLTDLWSGERVRKDDLRVEAYGTVDELDSVLGEARHWLKRDDCRAAVDEIQRDLYRLASELATRSGQPARRLDSADAERLASRVAALESDIPLSGFVIPGSTLASAKLDVARTVCRRAERRMVTLAREAEVSQAARTYVNRLSDLLFMLARAEESSDGALRYVEP
ncbi:MAG: cob(I)yrinic acid a,c-diamide adenosyltransferase [Spirochaetales bacterium]|nr:cob(I)yrinic acid a,c-diamide adenosyltransferase [Spirochaetales bacterium]MBP7263841.1 cob(I)yrinic acid a,c-diamide adenosyltransferase [Spirochaetia bacterium]